MHICTVGQLLLLLLLADVCLGHSVKSVHVMIRSGWPQHGTMQDAKQNKDMQACILVIMSSCHHLSE